MKALVVGYGSIGSRHARLLAMLGCEVAVVSSRDIDFPIHYRTLTDGLSGKPDYVVIANRTSQHYQTVMGSLLEIFEMLIQDDGLFRGGRIEETMAVGMDEVEIFRHAHSEKAPDQVSKRRPWRSSSL